MSQDDDEWALGWLADHPGLEECSSARVPIDRITHRAVCQVPELDPDLAREGRMGWRTLCKAHRLWIREGRFAVAGNLSRQYDFSSAGVDCLCCLPAGG